MDRLLDHRVGVEFPQDLQGPLSAVIHHALQIAVEDRPQSAADFKTACVEIAIPRPTALTDSVPLGDEVWNPSTTFLSHILQGHTGKVRDLDFSLNGRTLASGGEDKTVRLWNVATGSLHHTLKAHEGEVLAVAFSFDGWILASGGEDKIIHLWDVDTGTLIRTIRGHNDAIYSLSFTLDGQILASGEDGKIVCLWDVATGTLIRTIIGHEDEVLRVGMSHNSRILVGVDAASEEKTFRLWCVHAGKPTHTFTTERLRSRESQGRVLDFDYNEWSVRLERHGDGCTWALHGESRSQADSRWTDSIVYLKDLETGEIRHTLTGHHGVYSMRYSHDGKLLACGGGNGDVYLWNGGCLRQASVLEGMQTEP